jgi:molybdate transport system substrate-binding protein
MLLRRVRARPNTMPMSIREWRAAAHFRRCLSAVSAALMLMTVIAPRATEAAELRVFSTGAPSAAAKVIAAKFSAETGHTVAFTVGPLATIQQKLAAGEQADVVIVPTTLIAALENEGKLRVRSSVNVARVGIGIVVREGAPRPDVATLASIRKLLVDAPAIAYPDPESVVGKAITHMIEQMGIADVVKPKVTLSYAITGGVNLVADGKVDVGLFIISEILPVKGVTLVGPLPAEFQSYIVFDAAITSDDAASTPAASHRGAFRAQPRERHGWQPEWSRSAACQNPISLSGALARKLRHTRSGRQRSLREISRELAERGYFTAKTGKPFVAAQVASMLRGADARSV